jgi:predicted GNAT family acetyltransferase
MLARVAPWLPSADASTGAATRDVPRGSPRAEPPEFRVLENRDTAALWHLVDADPTANVFLASHLEAACTAARSPSGGEVVGLFRHGILQSACWAGVNLVPVGVADDDGARLGAFLAENNRRFSSIFGPSSSVMSIWSALAPASPAPFDVRPDQPLLELREAPHCAPAPGLRFTRPEELETILPACAAMFEEEVGYSPYLGGAEHYRRRVASLVSRRHSLMDLDSRGRVIFKAELGTVSARTVQVQGVWMNPRYRGRGLAAGYMAAVAAAARRLAPVVSLYVNGHNGPARAAYRRVGFSQVGTFATVLC